MRNRSGLDDKRREEMLTRALRISGGEITRAADILGVSRKTVYRWMRTYGLVLSRTTVKVLDK